MASKTGIHIVIGVVQKGWSTAVTEAVSNKVVCDCMIFYGANIPLDQKSLMGIQIREENELVITLVTEENLDEVLQLMAESGKVKSGKGCTCISFPVDKIILPTTTVEEEPQPKESKDGKERIAPGWKILGSDKNE